MIDPKLRCSERVYSVGGWHTHQCYRRGVIERNGSLYCKQHDPVAIEEKNKKARELCEKEYVLRNASWRRKGAMEAALKGVSTDDIIRYVREKVADLIKGET